MALVISVPANASIIFTESVFGSGDNILFGTAQTGMTITGTLNGNSNVVADFTGTGTLTTAGIGQASVNFLSPALQSLITINFTNLTPTMVLINPSLGSGQTVGTATQATVNVTAQEPGGGTSTASTTYNIGNGSNFLTITGINGETVQSITITANGTFASLAQVRVDGPFVPLGGGGGDVIPEPMTLSLVGASLVGVAFVRRRVGRQPR
jgi:hypothetical protein